MRVDAVVHSVSPFVETWVYRRSCETYVCLFCRVSASGGSGSSQSVEVGCGSACWLRSSWDVKARDARISSGVWFWVPESAATSRRSSAL